MNYLNTYKLFESNSEFDIFKNEVTDYLSDLTDTNNFRVDTKFLHSSVECVYVCKVIGENYIILWKDIKDIVIRFIEMSEFKLSHIKVSPIRYGDSYITKKIIRVPDEEELSHIELYFKK